MSGSRRPTTDREAGDRPRSRAAHAAGRAVPPPPGTVRRPPPVPRPGNRPAAIGTRPPSVPRPGNRPAAAGTRPPPVPPPRSHPSAAGTRPPPIPTARAGDAGSAPALPPLVIAAEKPARFPSDPSYSDVTEIEPSREPSVPPFLAERNPVRHGDPTEIAPPPADAARADTVDAAEAAGAAQAYELYEAYQPYEAYEVYEACDADAARSRPGGERAGRPLRDRRALPRTPGAIGDVRYLFLAVRGVRRARLDLADAEERLPRVRAARDRELAALARTSVAAEEAGSPALAAAREALAAIEERRAHHAGRAAAAENELAEIQQACEIERRRNADERRRLDRQLDELAGALRELERRGAAALAEAGELSTATAAIDRAIALEERKLVAVKRPALATVVESRLAAARADRDELACTEKQVGAELDDAELSIASIRSTQADLRVRVRALAAAERECPERWAERAALASACRVVAERAAADAEQERARALRELGEELLVERPHALATRLAAIDAYDREVADLERCAFECAQLIAGLQRGAIVRGALLVASAAVLIGAALWLLLA